MQSARMLRTNRLSHAFRTAVTFSLVTLLSFIRWRSAKINKAIRLTPSQLCQTDSSYLPAHCYGCHQPAKALGEYEMTRFEQLLAAGSTGKPAIVPGKPADSHLLSEIAIRDGKAKMPKNKPPLKDSEIALIKTWIEQGAKNDSVELAVVTADKPPIYTRPANITSLDFLPMAIG